MLEDVFKKLADADNKSGQELLEILNKRRKEYEKYPEYLVLVRVFKEFLHNRNKACNDDQYELSTKELDRICNEIYDDNAFSKMNDCFASKIVSPVPSENKKKFVSYWERFVYNEGKTTSWRIALNIMPEKELLEKVNEFAKKYQCNWKYVGGTYEYNNRKDPMIIYFHEETDNDKEKIFGYENIKDGMFYAEFTTIKRFSKALYNCFSKEDQAHLETITYFDEVDKFAKKAITNPAKLYIVNSLVYNHSRLSGGQLAILEWLTEANNVVEDAVVFHDKDGTSIHKKDIFVFKKMGEHTIWHRLYLNKYRRVKERIFPKPNTCPRNKTWSECIVNIYDDEKLISTSIPKSSQKNLDNKSNRVITPNPSSFRDDR